MRASTAIASSATTASARYAPRNGVTNNSLVNKARLGPTTAPSRPPAITSDTAFSRAPGAASSADANR
ncbi:Uncharacterised protein [Bordetella pertussis]|nr:Uncharacterised protein [Bordetella pertussis]CPL11175.1 Uncharacterised protein [Bordetella pertussis]